MSLPNDTNALLAENNRLKAESRFDAAKIEKLEQQIRTLEVEKELSVAKTEDLAPQTEVSIGSSGSALRAENSKLKDELLAKETQIGAQAAAIAQRDRKISDFHTTMTSLLHWLDAASKKSSSTSKLMDAARRLIKEGIEVSAPKEEYRPRKEATHNASTTDTDRSGEQFSTSSPITSDRTPTGSPRETAFGPNRIPSLFRSMESPEDRRLRPSTSSQSHESQSGTTSGLEKPFVNRPATILPEDMGLDDEIKTRELFLYSQRDPEETDADRNRGPALSPLSNTQASHPTASSSKETEIEPTLHAPNLEETFPWPRPMRCAFVVKSGDRSTGPAGDPFQATNGWAVRLGVDAGRHGRPTISLHFAINNGKKDAPLSRNRDQRTEFAITWLTSAVNYGRPMIEDFVMINKSSRSQQELTKFMAVTFKRNGEVKPNFSATAKKPWKGLHADVQLCLDNLFLSNEPQFMTIWFCVDSTPKSAMSTWLSAIQRAVKQS